MSNCAACAKPAPAEWCWAARTDCPLQKPPRNLTVESLWAHITELEKRITALENPPCCGGGPQWGHAWTCPRLPG